MKEKRELAVLMAFTALLMLGVVLCNVFTAPMPSGLTIAYSSGATASEVSSVFESSSSAGEETENNTLPTDEKVNINTADVEELCRLPGVGEEIAGRIIGYRQEYGPYTDPAQLKNIKGIGDKVYEKLLPMVTW